MGVKPGPEFERILSRIFALQLDGKIKSHPQLMKEMRELAGIKEPAPAPPVTRKTKEAPPETPSAHPHKKGRGATPYKSRAATAAPSPAASTAPPAKAGRRTAHSASM